MNDQQKAALMERARAFVAGASDPALVKHRALCAKIASSAADGVNAMKRQHEATNAMKKAVSDFGEAAAVNGACVDLLATLLDEDVTTSVENKVSPKRTRRTG